jgi:hypothetical protein
MQSRKCSRLLGSGFLVLLAGALALAACNSDGVSNSSQKPSGSTGVSASQVPAPTRAAGKPTMADALAAQANNPR